MIEKALQDRLLADCSAAAVVWVVTGHWPKPEMSTDVVFMPPQMNGWWAE